MHLLLGARQRKFSSGASRLGYLHRLNMSMSTVSHVTLWSTVEGHGPAPALTKIVCTRPAPDMGVQGHEALGEHGCLPRPIAREAVARPRLPDVFLVVEDDFDRAPLRDQTQGRLLPNALDPALQPGSS